MSRAESAETNCDELREELRPRRAQRMAQREGKRREELS
jgi:hypothetical protein